MSVNVMTTKAIFLTLTAFLLIQIRGFAAELVPKRIVGVEYPAMAYALRLSGTVKIKCTIDLDGQVVSAELIEATEGRGVRQVLGFAAQENAKKWIFSRVKSTDTSTIVVLTYTFTLRSVTKVAQSTSTFVFDLPDQITIIGDIPPPQP